MPFPEVQRVVYGKNPLLEVVCQLRFPPILRIDADIPAGFQERVRSSFPDFDDRTEMVLETPKGAEFPSELLSGMIQPTGVRNYSFRTEDGNWRLNLTRTFLALTAYSYSRWEGFKDRLVEPLQALAAEYSPSYYSRVGLRYVDFFRRSALGLSHADWDDLLKPYVLGVVGAPRVCKYVRSFEARYEVELEDRESLVRIVSRLVKDPLDGEECFLLDSDFYFPHKVTSEDIVERLNFLNSRASRLIQWAITPKLHEAMEPQVI